MRSLLALLAGFSALGAEVAFSRRCELLLGNTGATVAVVLSSYLGGLALGALLYRRSPWALARPWRAFGLAQGSQALLIFGSAHLLPGCVNLAGGGALPRLLVASLLLALPALAAGFAFPALVALFERGERRTGGTPVGAAYALETLGAVIGSLASGFVLYREFGLSRSFDLLALVALMGGLLALIRSRQPASRNQAEIPPALGGEPGERRALLALALAGAAVLGLELLYTRLLLFFLPGLVAAFSAALAGILVGTSLGSWWGGLRARKGASRGLAVWCLLSAASGVAVSLAILPLLADGMRLLPRPLGGGYQPGMEMATSFGLAFLLALPATAGSGAALPLVVKAMGGSPTLATGRAYAWSSFGSVIGVLAAAFFAGAWLPLRLAVVACGLLLVLSAMLLWKGRADGRGPWVAASLVSVLLLSLPRSEGLLLLSTEFKKSTARGRTLLDTAEDQHLVASVVDLGQARGRALYTNAFMAASTGELYGYMRMLGHLPALLASDPKDVLVIAYGTGTTVGSLAVHEQVRSIVIAELSGAVMQLAHWFDDANRGVPHRTSLGKQVSLNLGDGRSYLERSRKRFDVITLEPLPPNTPAAVHFYTSEFYESCRGQLNHGGVLCQWIPLNSVPTDGFRILLRTFAEQLPITWLFLFDQSVLLIGAGDEQRQIDLQSLMRRADQPAVRADLRSANMEDVAAILASFVTDREGLLEATRDVPAMSDDRPLVALRLARPDRLAIENTEQNASFLAEIRKRIDPHLNPTGLEPELLKRFRTRLQNSYEAKGLMLEARFDPARRDFLWSRALVLSPQDLEAARRLARAGIQSLDARADLPTWSVAEIEQLLVTDPIGDGRFEQAIEAAGKSSTVDAGLLLPLLDHADLEIRLLAMVALKRRLGDVADYDPMAPAASRRAAQERLRLRLH